MALRRAAPAAPAGGGRAAPPLPQLACRALRSARATARRVRDAWRGASLVLLYHRVTRPDADPWSLCVAPERFAEQLDVLMRHRAVRPLDDLAGDAGRTRRAVFVTVDDGYADFASAALPLLERFDVPVTLFATTGRLDEPRELWWDELERCVLVAGARPSRLALEVAGGRRWWPVPRELAGRARLYHELHPLLGGLPAHERDDVLDQLCAWAGVDAAARPTHRTLRAAELATVAAHPLVTLGAHTVSHPYLSRLDLDAQRSEIRGARTRLVETTGRRVDWFSYPHGDGRAETVRLVREAGFRAACGSDCAAAHAGSDPFRLPRIEVPDVGGEEFERWLGGWLAW